MIRVKMMRPMTMGKISHSRMELIHRIRLILGTIRCLMKEF